MTSKEKDVYKSKHFSVRLNKELDEALKIYMGVHKCKKTNAIKKILSKELTEKTQILTTGTPTPTPVVTQWEEIDCSFLFVEGKLGFCTNRTAPIRLPLKFTAEVCRHCQSVSIKQAQEDNILKALNLNVSGKRRSQVAQALIGLQTQINASSETISQLNGRIESWKTRYDEVNIDRDSWKAKALSTETNKNLQKENADLEKEISEKHEIIANAERINKLNQELNNELSVKEQEKVTLTSKVDSLSKKLEETEQDKIDLQNEINELKKNPRIMVLCPEKGAVDLKFCMKDCEKYVECSLALRNKELSEKTLPGVCQHLQPPTP